MIVHHLKANDYILLPWEDMHTFPKDGSSVEVQDDKGEVYRARWAHNHIMVDCEHQVRLTGWRPIT